MVLICIALIFNGVRKSLHVYFLKDFMYLFLDRRREEERERNISVVAPCMSPIGDLARNPGISSDWELNW